MSMISTLRATLASFALGAMLAVQPAAAAEFSVMRGLNMDQWVTWPQPDRWNSDEVLANFPEWKRFVTADDLAQLRASGLDFLRMPVDPAVFLVDEDEARWARLLDQVTEAVDRVRAAGLKVIVDLHTIPRDDDYPAPGTVQIFSDPARLAAYRRLVDDMAAGLARYDSSHVALELANEPLFGCGRGDRQWQALLVDLHAAARAANPAITLVAPGACWGSADGLAAVDPGMLADANMIWSFHSYEPFMLTHQSAGWAGDSVKHLSGLPYPFSEYGRRERMQAVEANRQSISRNLTGSSRREATGFLVDHSERLASGFRLRRIMREPFRTAARWADRNNIPRDRILLGEFGMIRQEWQKEPATRPEWRAAYYRDMIALAEEYGFAWSMWSYGGAFGIVDAFSGDKAEPDVLEMVRRLPPR